MIRLFLAVSLFLPVPTFAGEHVISYMDYYNKVRGELTLEKKPPKRAIYRSSTSLGERFGRLYNAISTEQDPERIKELQKEAIDVVTRLSINASLVGAKTNKRFDYTKNGTMAAFFIGGLLGGVVLARHIINFPLHPMIMDIPSGFGGLFLAVRFGVPFFTGEIVGSFGYWLEQRSRYKVIRKFIKGAAKQGVEIKISRFRDSEGHLTFKIKTELQNSKDACMQTLLGGNVRDNFRTLY